MKRLIRNAVRLLPALLIVAAAFATPAEFYQTYIPAGVEIGMSRDEVQKARPQAMKGGMSQPSAAKPDATFVQMAEIMPQGNTRVAYWYRFKSGKLGVVTRSLMVTGMPIEHAQAGASKVVDELKADFVLKGQEQVARSTGTENTVVTAQLWEDAAAGRNIYFVTTNREITVVVFDPKAFGKADFFLGPERMKDLNAHAEAVRGMVDKAAATPVPIVDLLPKAAAANPSPTPVKPTAAIPTPATPVPPATPVVHWRQQRPWRKLPLQLLSGSRRCGRGLLEYSRWS
jgi:hypothetical protein